MKYKKKQTYEITKFEFGMEDGYSHNNMLNEKSPYINKPDGNYEFVRNVDDCYIIKNDLTGSIELVGEKHLKQYYEEV